MRYTVSCATCHVEDVAVTANRDDAQHVASRHHTLTGHTADVTQILDTPFEGII
jgi:hypothetical protein